MILRNLKNAYSNLTCYQSNIARIHNGNYIDSQGSNLILHAGSFGNTYYMTNSTSVSNCSQLILGAGDTPVTENDYRLSSLITNGALTLKSWTNLKKDGDNSFIDGLFVYANETNEDVTVKEMGYLWDAGSNGSYALMTREVLETPVVIHPTETRSFRGTISFEDIV